MRKILIVSVIAILIVGVIAARLLSRSKLPNKSINIPPQFTDTALFLTTIKQVASAPKFGLVTGITVPHHLLARDLIAETFAAASVHRYRQVILISPDHFNLGLRNISTTERNFSTVFGTLPTDTDLARELAKVSNVSLNGDFFYREHGLQGELPFIKYYFPDTTIVALTIKPEVKKTELDAVVEALKTHLDKDSLIIQSTDFSHYLTKKEADGKDQETIKILKTGNPEAILQLSQPDHMDSVAAEYLQLRLQYEFYYAELTITNHKNSQEYITEPVAQTTSYLTQVFVKK